MIAMSSLATTELHRYVFDHTMNMGRLLKCTVDSPEGFLHTYILMCIQLDCSCIDLDSLRFVVTRGGHESKNQQWRECDRSLCCDAGLCHLW